VRRLARPYRAPLDPKQALGDEVSGPSLTPSPVAATTVRGMEARTVHLHVEVVVDGSVIAGEVKVLEGGPVRRFSGRLGLITAIEQALNVPEGEGTGSESPL
jgi:hypothetical protein